ncbi:TatD family hydrolase [Bradyrhizobium sp. RDI18]|uniref:TatD family hydrolase n=1 Tax=Bradyrhizobium sp. RDI18 TaxID=3367400 RepID=UPI003716B09B
MQRAAALGCYFSVNAEMTRSDRGRILVTEMPLDRILTETDGPSLKWKAGRRSRQTSD